MGLDISLIKSGLSRIAKAAEQTQKDYYFIRESLEEKRRGADYATKKDAELDEIAILISVPIQYLARLKGKDHWGVRSN